MGLAFKFALFFGFLGALLGCVTILGYVKTPGAPGFAALAVGLSGATLGAIIGGIGAIEQAVQSGAEVIADRLKDVARAIRQSSTPEPEERGDDNRR